MKVIAQQYRRKLKVKHTCFCIIQDDYRPLTCENIMFGNALIRDTLLQDPQVLSDIESNHWLMTTNPPSQALQQILAICINLVKWYLISRVDTG